MAESPDELREPRGPLKVLGASVATAFVVLGSIAILIAAAISLHYIVSMFYLSWMFVY